MNSGWKDQFFATVVARHGRPLMKFFAARLPNAAEAPDLVQEVYLRLVRLEHLDLIRSPEAYLFTVAANIVREHRLKSAKQPVQIALQDLSNAGEDGGSGASPDFPASTELLCEDMALQDERIRQIERVLAELPPKAQAAFVWHRRDGQTYKEIGARLGVSTTMVKKYLAQTVAHCRKRLIEQEGSACDTTLRR